MTNREFPTKKYYPEALDHIERLQKRVQELERLLDKANACIGSVVACCTYGSEQAAKTGAYGISPDAFTKIDTYMRTISESNWQPLPQPTKEGE